MKRLIFATGNQNKMREIREILADLPVEILSMKEACFCSAEGKQIESKDSYGKETDFYCCTRDLKTEDTNGPDLQQS